MYCYAEISPDSYEILWHVGGIITPSHMTPNFLTVWPQLQTVVISSWSFSVDEVDSVCLKKESLIHIKYHFAHMGRDNSEIQKDSTQDFILDAKHNTVISYLFMIIYSNNT